MRPCARPSGAGRVSTRPARSTSRSPRCPLRAPPHPALRYGRFYFRPSRPMAATFGITTFTQGVLVFSRILNDQEVVVVANTNTASDQGQEVDVIVDGALNADGAAYMRTVQQQTRSYSARPRKPGHVERDRQRGRWLDRPRPA